MVKKTTHRGIIQLVGNLRKIDFSVFYKKVNSITGFGVVPLPSSQQPVPVEESRLLMAEETTAREDILHSLEACRGTPGITIHSHPTQPWVICNYSHRGQTHASVAPATAQQVHSLIAWAFQYMFSESMTDGTPLTDTDSMTVETSTKVPQHTPLRRITRSDWGIPPEQNRCDVVALVVQVILREGAMSELILWDGTVSHGLLSKDSYFEAPHTLPSRIVKQNQDVLNSVSTFRDVCHGLFTSCMFASDTPAFLEKLKFILESSHANDFSEFETNTLMGQAVCVTTADSHLNSHIANLRAGQWVRLRNLHLDFSPFHHATPHVNLAGQEMVASIYADTHITPIYPFFRYVAYLCCFLCTLYNRYFVPVLMIICFFCICVRKQ